MKKFLLLLAAVGMIFSACEQGGVLDEENNGNSTEQPDNGNNGDNGNSGEMIPTNEIWYTSTDGDIVTPYATDVFGANIVSNTYENGKGVIVFDAPVTSIGTAAFYECSSLTSVTIPDSVNEIGTQAFFDCSSLTAFYGEFASVDNRCLIIDGVLNSFAPAGLTEYTIPNSVTLIGVGAFYDCSSLTCVVIPNSVTEIGVAAFAWCSSIASVVIPDSVTSIGSSAFNGCMGLTSVTIGNSVTSIGNSAFCECTSLKEVYCKPIMPPVGGRDMFYHSASECKIYVPTASVNAYKTADGWSNYAYSIVGYDF